MNGHITRRLNGHDLDIQSLCWEPSNYRFLFILVKFIHFLIIIRQFKLGNEVTPEYTRLVSGSRDKTVRIWNVEGEKLARTITMPGHLPHLTDQQKGRLFMSTVWVPGRNWLVSASYM